MLLFAIGAKIMKVEKKVRKSGSRRSELEAGRGVAKALKALGFTQKKRSIDLSRQWTDEG